MKKVVILFALVLMHNSLLAQSEDNSEPNTTIIRLLILNDNGEILLKKATIGWVIMDKVYEQRQTLNEAINSLSNKYGASISKPELKGVFTYKFGFNNSSSIRQIYVAKSTTNDLPKNKNVEFYWAPKDEAIEKLSGTVPSLGEMVEQILDYPQVVWGGSFLIKRENEKITSEQKEDFYPISNPSTYIKEPNKTVIRLTILNENGDILMKKSDYGWMTIATFYTETQNINEVIDSLSNEYGIEITKPSLAGVFTYKYKFKESSDIRQLYTANYIKGNLESSKDKHNLTWLPKEEAIEKLKETVPSLGQMTEQVLNFSNVVWGGSFLLDRDENWKLSSEITEDFYPIRNPQFTTEQSERPKVEEALQKYMEGSSYNKLELLESAFTKNATLYLTGREGDFKIYTPEEYTGFFKNKEKGEFNGRDTKVLTIEVVRDIATAKVEIAGPERKWVYIDLFLLKKFEDGWKIISKTATRVDDGVKE